MDSTLALKKSDFESEVGFFMGWGRGEVFGDPPWSDRNLRSIRMDVGKGLHNFYFCGHPWSFLQPTREIEVPSGAESVILPDDFGEINGGVEAVVQQTSDGLGRWMVPFVNPARIVQARTLSPEQTGVPTMLAQRPAQEHASGKVQRNELLVYPTADQAYTLSFPYHFNPDYLVDVTQPFAYGGLDHHQTIMQMCVAAAELTRDNMMGVQDQKAREALQRSMMIDRRKNPNRLGQQIELSDEMDWPYGRHGDLNGRGWQDQGGVRVNGTLYT